MGDMLPLRDYQQACIDAVRTDWDAGIRRPASVLPTGSGKTVIFSHLSKQWRDMNASRVMILVHRDELIIQTANKLRAIAPHLSVGIVKGSKREINRDVIVVSVQSLRSKAARDKITHVGLIIVDECHHATAKTYRDILDHYGALHEHPNDLCNPEDDAIAIGFTATLARGDGVSLGDIWQRVSYRKDILWMIRRRFLLDVYAKRVEVDDLSFANVRSRGGDYQEGDLGTALMESLAPEVTAAAYLEHATYVDDGEVKLRSGVGFAPTVESAFAFAEAFNKLDIKSEVVTGETAAEERRAIFGRCHDGTTAVLWNCGVATEGTDVPVWSCAVIARPTKSSPLYQQMVGRVLRPHPGQGPGQPIGKALVLDVVGVTRAHQLRSLVDLTGKTFREEVKEDESLLDHDEFELMLEEEPEQRGAGGDLAWEYLDGPTRTVEVDLFAASRQQWLQTDAGIWFVSAGKNHFVFLVPAAVEPGAFDVAWCTKRRAGKGRSGGVTEHVAVPLDLAMAWGEDVVSEYPDADLIADKNRSWRKGKPTQRTIDYARGLGLIFPADIKAHDLSNMIAHCEATQRIDAIAKLMGRI